MSFYLFDTPDEKLRLKAFAGTSRNGKMIVKIEVETDDPWSFAYALERLGEVQKGQSAKPPRPKKTPPAPAPLRLPAPVPALPKP